jgi:hypothetical protein
MGIILPCFAPLPELQDKKTTVIMEREGGKNE